MMYTFWTLALGCIALLNLVAAQDCGLPCIADVNGTTCAQSEWSCLCGYDQYLQRVSECAQSACNQADYDTTITAVAELCAIFNDTVTIAPYATASTGTQNPVLSTVALSTSLPPTISTIPSTSGSTIGSADASSTATSQDIAGTSISTMTTTGVPTESEALPTASSTTTNIAQRVDLKTTALHGIALALLGLAVYL